MPKELNKADSYRKKAYEGDTQAMNNLGVSYGRGNYRPEYASNAVGLRLVLVK